MPKVLGVEDEEFVAPAQSEDAIALAFADAHAEHLRHVEQWKRWMIFDGRKWVHDETRKVFSMARDACRIEASKSNSKQAAIASARTRMNVLSLASDDRRIAAGIDQWDADPWLLNTPGGVVDLRTGEKQPTSPHHYMTKITAADPGGECPIWRDFLKTVTGDDEVVRYLQRVAGYCLTGLTTEHALFFLFGPGANGKSVFISTLAGMVGDYHTTSSMETFTASMTERHPTDLAMLRGARLVTATETEDGRDWAESRLKTVTGGDAITARFMRQDFFTYIPQFKLLVAGNHKPGLISTDEAMRRRLNLIPFEVIIAAGDRDHELAEKLKAEWPGILQWAIDGCLDWQKVGLQPPERVVKATDAYVASEDVFKQWRDECCLEGPDCFGSTASLWSSWNGWARHYHEKVGTRGAFRKMLIAKKYEPGRGEERGFHGLMVNPDYKPPM